MILLLSCVSVAIITVESDHLVLCTVFCTIKMEEYYYVTFLYRLKLPACGFERNYNAVTREGLKNFKSNLKLQPLLLLLITLSEVTGSSSRCFEILSLRAHIVWTVKRCIMQLFDQFGKLFRVLDLQCMIKQKC